MKKRSESATKTTISNNEKETKGMKAFEKNINLTEEKKGFEMVISYDCDMRPLYELLLSKCGKDMPTLIVLEKLPDEFIKAGYGFVSSPENQNKLILLLKNSDNITMQSILSEAISAYKNKNSLEFRNVYSPTIRIDEISHLAHNSFMYEHALNVATMLNIPCPQIIMKESAFMSVDGCVEFIKFDGRDIGWVIFLRKNGRIKQLISLAHELRHCWQLKYTDGKYFTDEVNSQNFYEYLYQKTEIDAQAFALKYVEKIKRYSNALPLLFDTSVDYKPNQYTRTLKEHMEKIQLSA